MIRGPEDDWENQCIWSQEPFREEDLEKTEAEDYED